MGAKSRALTAATLGAWLVKGNGDLHPTHQVLETGFATVHTWCVQPSYRTDLVRPGQPVLFWLSGSSRPLPAGIYGQGHTTGPAHLDADQPDASDRARPKWVMPVVLRPLSSPVPRAALLADPRLSQIEVLKMAAGSNPSFLTPDDLAALKAAWPQVTF